MFVVFVWFPGSSPVLHLFSLYIPLSHGRKINTPFILFRSWMHCTCIQIGCCYESFNCTQMPIVIVVKTINSSYVFAFVFAH